MRRIGVAVGVALVTLLTLVAVPASAVDGGTVTGFVRDAAGSPVPGVTVSYGGMPGSGPTTGADGSYSVHIPTGAYAVMVGVILADGSGKYSATASARVTVNGDMTEDFTVPAIVPVDVAMRSADNVAMTNVAIETPQSVALTTNPDGTRITWFGSPLRYTSDPPFVSDHNGSVTFSGLLNSTATVQPHLPDTYPVKLPVSVTQSPTLATVTMPRLSQLSGTVHAPGAYVDVVGHDGTTLQMRSSGDGAYVGYLPDGMYRFEASWDGSPQGFDAADVKGTVDVSGATVFSVPAFIPATLRVHLQNPDGSPATNSSVTRTDSSGTVRSSTDASLEYSMRYIAHVAPDQNGVAVTQAVLGSSTTVSVAVPDQTGVVTREVEIQQDPTDTTMTLKPASATVSGVVRDDQGSALSGASVYVVSLDTNTGTATTTAADGTWTAQVVPGDVSVRIEATGTAGPASTPYMTVGSATINTTLTPTQDVHLPTPTVFTPSVRNSTGDAVPGIRVFVGTSKMSRPVGGVTYDITSSATGLAASDSDGKLPMVALPDSRVDGALRQPDGYVFPFHLDTSANSTTPAVITLGWYGSVPSSGAVAGAVSIASPPGTTLSQMTSQPASTLPDGQTALVGDVAYQVSDITPGASVDVTLTLPVGSQPTKVFKVANDGTTVDATDHATFNNNVIVVHLTDGGFGDADGAANGVIVDPLMPIRATSMPAVIPGEPTVSGMFAVGRTLTAAPGSWGPGDVTLAYQWLRSGIDIPGATSRTYLLTPGDVGKYVAVRVIGSKAGYKGALATTHSAGVAPGRLVEFVAPYVYGKPQVGYLLGINSGRWSPAGFALRYQWLRDGRPVSGVTANSHWRVRWADRGHRISARVYVSKVAYATRVVTTGHTAAVR